MVRLHPLKVVFFLSYASLAFSLCIGVLLRSLSLPLLTMVYHGVILFAHRHDIRRGAIALEGDEESGEQMQRNPYPAASLASVVILGLLIFAWGLSLALYGWIAFHSWAFGVKLQYILSAMSGILVEVALLVAIAVICTRLRRRASQ